MYSIKFKYCFFIVIVLLSLKTNLKGQEFSISSNATFSLGSAILSLPGNWNNSGTLNAQNGTILFNGSSGDQTITKTNGETFNHLTINKTLGNLKLLNDITVNGTLKLSAGNLNLNGNIVTLSTSADLDETGSCRVYGTSGYLKTTRDINNPASLDVAGLGAVLTSSADLGEIIIARGHKPQSGSGNSGILRYYDISPNNNSNLNATFTMCYNDNELNGLDESRLQFMRSTDNGVTWTLRGGVIDTVRNEATLTGINSFSRWALAFSHTPIIEAIGNKRMDYGGTLQIALSATDPDGDALVYTASSSTTDVKASVSGSVLSLTPQVNKDITATITVTVSDGALTDQTTFSLRVDDVYYGPTVSKIPDQTINEGGSFTKINLNLYVTDIDNSDSQIGWTVSGNTNLSVAIDASKNAVVTNKDVNWNGTEVITFTARDPGGLTQSTTATFKVLPVNDAPTMSGIETAALSYREGDGSKQITASLILSDVDDSIIEGAVVAISVNYQNGEDVLEFTNTAKITGTWDVATGKMTLAGSDSVSKYQAALRSVTYKNTSTDPVTSVARKENQRIIRAATPRTISFTVNDGELTSPAITRSIEVTAVNEIPYVSINTGLTLEEGGTKLLSKSLLEVLDLDDDSTTITYNVTALPQNGTLSKSGTALIVGGTFTQANLNAGLLSYTHDGGESLADSIKVNVKDDEGAETGVFAVLITITAKNDSPVLSALPSIVFNEDSVYLQKISDWYGYVADADDADSTLVFLLSCLGGNLTITETNAGQEITNNVENWNGSDSIKVSVTDGLDTVSTVVLVTVTPVNDLPVITGLPETVTFISDTTAELNLWDYVSDVETADKDLLYSITSDSSQLTIVFNDTTGQVLFSSPAQVEFEAEVLITITDSDSGVVTGTLTVKSELDVTGVENSSEELPSEYTLAQNYPNPFNPSTIIEYGLPEESHVSIKVFNMIGQQVAELVNRTESAGFHNVSFDASALTSGIYFYKIKAGSFTEVKKMILLR